ncbi:hypothetical protein D3C85_905430 [compost metagenome]
MRIACGMTMRRSSWLGFIPSETAASVCPFATAFNPPRTISAMYPASCNDSAMIAATNGVMMSFIDTEKTVPMPGNQRVTVLKTSERLYQSMSWTSAGAPRNNQTNVVADVESILLVESIIRATTVPIATASTMMTIVSRIVVHSPCRMRGWKRYCPTTGHWNSRLVTTACPIATSPTSKRPMATYSHGWRRGTTSSSSGRRKEDSRGSRIF